MDAQQIDLLGVNHVRVQLLREGIELAEPARDRGIDLIAYLDREERTFCARPIQIKSSLDFRWVHLSKYAAFPSLLIAHVMFLADPRQTVVYAMTYAESHAIAENCGYLHHKLWLEPEKGLPRVWVQKANEKLSEELARYRIAEGRWRKIVAASQLSS